VVQTKYLEETLTCIELSADNSVVVTGSRGGSLHVWDFDKQKIPDEPSHRLVGHDFSLAALAISTEQDLVVSGSLSGLFVHSILDGRFIRVIQHQTGRQPYLVLLTRETEIIVYYQDIQEIVVYSLNGRLLHSTKVPEHILSLTLSPDGQFLVTGGFSKTLTVYLFSCLSLEQVHKTEPASSSIRTVTIAGKVEQGEHYAIVGLASGYILICAMDFNKWLRDIKGETFEDRSMSSDYVVMFE